jgi:sialate O-acetylesterase
MKSKVPIIFTLLSLLLLAPIMMRSQITLPAIIGNNMVLQQKQQVPLWGWYTPNKVITITLGWNNERLSAITEPDGEWHLTVKTPSAGGPYSIQINDTLLSNIMIGEVWLCSGQSNMQMSVCEAMDAEKEIKSAENPSLRLFTVSRQFSEIPKKNCYGHWLECSPENVEGFSAVAYYFGKELYQQLKVPIGLINASWGGTPAEAWTSNEILKSDKDLLVLLRRFEEKAMNSEPGVCPFDQNSPSALYNGMIAPLIPFRIRGVIWYQGEANVGEPLRYEVLFPAMIQNWRRVWRAGDFPFYYVQIAPYEYEIPLSGALLRDAQRKTLSLVNTGMVVTLDIGNPVDIHPVNKQAVGKRLSLLALAKDYGRSDIFWTGPVFSSMNVYEDKIRLDFQFTLNKLLARDGELKNFEIAGDNKIFVPANAMIRGSAVIVSAPQIKSPRAVRYAFHNTDEASLFSSNGLPAASFRTDNWPVNIEKTEINGILDTVQKDIIISMGCFLNPMEIRYTTDGNKPNRQSDLYTAPFHLKKSAILKASAFECETQSSYISSLDINYHLAFGKKPDIKYPYNAKYKAGESYALTDGLRGSTHFGDGNWQGYLFNDLEVVIDLEKQKKINKISVGFLQSVNDWIFFPQSIEIFVSENGQEYSSIGVNVPETALSSMPLQKHDFTFNLKGLKTRYIKVKATSIKVCPEGHPGQGSMAWMFVDEILVE